jgi:hypothetical protein
MNGCETQCAHLRLCAKRSRPMQMPRSRCDGCSHIDDRGSDRDIYGRALTLFGFDRGADPSARDTYIGGAKDVNANF